MFHTRPKFPRPGSRLEPLAANSLTLSTENGYIIVFTIHCLLLFAILAMHESQSICNMFILSNAGLSWEVQQHLGL